MSLPEQIKIGPMNYDVKEVTRLIGKKEDGNGVYLMGQIIYEECRINIEQDMNSQIKVAALWHELLHGILHQAGHDDHPESVIEALGYGLVQVIRDNPDLLKFTIG